ncbi:hypothetical protein ALNOE001_09590 [Candidatus Methanobinarius endosymbioticus]|uniref:Uncharacterized protein n=1 Tax=Candidatus Methanobinarius endosymbioticus TaxID=2006182 RepID=A0A366MCR1_9EURY|nr:hypothetical protein ALNOE001_09590 [Candidatus Methanobinarius endosymbioticus]
MVKRDARKVTEKWATNTSSATDRMREGVSNVTESPMKKAAQQQKVMRDRLLKAIDDGKWARGLNRVSIDEWKEAMDKGIDRVGSGVQASMGKTEKFFDEFLPHLEKGVAKLQPRGDLNANISRATEMIKHNAEFRRKGNK